MCEFDIPIIVFPVKLSADFILIFTGCTTYFLWKLPQQWLAIIIFGITDIMCMSLYVAAKQFAIFIILSTVIIIYIQIYLVYTLPHTDISDIYVPALYIIQTPIFILNIISLGMSSLPVPNKKYQAVSTDPPPYEQLDHVDIST